MMVEIQKEVTAMYELNDKKIGEHLKALIDERQVILSFYHIPVNVIHL